jgi:hypothetical protein
MTEFELKRMEGMTPKQRTAYRKFLYSAKTGSKCRKSRGVISCNICNDFEKCETPKNTDKYLALSRK